MAGMNGVSIIGAGPAGIAAAIFLKRARIELTLFEPGELGGLLRNANLVENYPGFSKGISGRELAARFAEHLALVGVKRRRQRVESLRTTRGGFRIETDASAVASRAVIVATGTVPTALDIKLDSAMVGKSVFYDVVSMPLGKSRTKRVLIVGGGDAAFDYALSLDDRGHKVTVVSRSRPRCLKLLLERAERRGIELKVGVIVKTVAEDEDGVSLGCLSGRSPLALSTDWLLVACGRSPNLEFVEPRLRRRMDVKTRPPETGVPGLFVAGDVVRGLNRQTGIAVGDGILAAMHAQRYLGGDRA